MLEGEMPRRGASAIGVRKGAMSESASAKTRRYRRANKKKRKVLRLIVWIAVSAVVAALAYFAVTVTADVQSGALGANPGVVYIAEGSATAEVASELGNAGIIRNELAFRVYSRLMGYDGKYRGGEFEIQPGSGYNVIMEQLTTTEGIRARVTLPEGYTAEQIAAAIGQSTRVSASEFLDAADNEYDFRFLPAAQRGDKLEGYLFPDTYYFTGQYTADDMVRVMLRRFGEIFTDEYVSRAQELGMSIDEVVILASIIEAEAGRDSDRARISGVFHNRLNSKTYPYLESCATINYILKDHKAVLSTADTRIDSPYNTYLYKGLPAGPICNPGKASLEAALYPEESDYLFFQSDSAGKIYYAETLEEHERIRREIQQ
jgi:UPF0755 protein